MRFELRRAEHRDIATIAKIWHAGWSDGHLGHVDQRLVDARTLTSFRHRTERCLAKITLAAATPAASSDDRVAGFVTVVDDEVEQIYVGAGHRGSGCAGLLLRAAEGQIARAGNPKAWLAVVAGNDPARRFYARHGWTDTGPMTYLAAGGHGSETSIPVTAHRYEKQLSRPLRGGQR